MNESRQSATPVPERRSFSSRILSGLIPCIRGFALNSFEIRAQDTKPAAAVAADAPKASPAPEPDLKKVEAKGGDSVVGTSTNTAPSEVPVVAVPLAAKSPVSQFLTRDKVEALQERIRPSVQNIEARGGAARFLWSQRHQPSSMLQLINPFAPTEYGVSSVSPNQIPASVAPGQPPLPRGFRDDRTHEANGIFLRAGW